jgi:hypothetical protein
MLADHLSHLFHGKINVALVIWLLARKVLCWDLVAKLPGTAWAFFKELGVILQGIRKGSIQVGHEFEYPLCSLL